MRTLDTIIAEAKKAFAEGNNEVLKTTLKELHRLPGGITQDIRGELRMSPLVISQILDAGEPPVAIPTAVRSNSTGLTLDEISAKIKELDKMGVNNTVEIGKCFMQAKETVGHGNWINWVSHNTGYSQQHANRLIRVHERFGNRTSMFSLKPELLFTLLTFSQELEEEVANAIHCFEVINDTDISPSLLTKLSNALVGIKDATSDSMAEALILIDQSDDVSGELKAVQSAHGIVDLTELLTVHTAEAEQREVDAQNERLANADKTLKKLSKASSKAIVTKKNSPKREKTEAEKKKIADATEATNRGTVAKSTIYAVNNSWSLENSSVKEIAQAFVNEGVNLAKLETYLERMDRVRKILSDSSTNNTLSGN